MGVVTEVAEDAAIGAASTVGISTWIWIFLGGVALLTTGFLLYHHHVFESGKEACRGEYAAAAVKQNATAQAEIATIGEKYAQIDQKLQQSADFMHPASPLVVAAIASMPAPHHGPKRSGQSVRPSGAAVGAGN